MRSQTLKRVAPYLANHDPELVRACLPFDTEEFQHEASDGAIENATIGCAVRWFATNYHGGQWSHLYAAGCKTLYSPGPRERGPEPESSDADLYEALAHIEENH